MARRDVVEVVCDRCGRTENQNSSELSPNTGPEFEVSFRKDKVIYEDLCKKCRNALKGYFDRMVLKTDDKVAEAGAVSDGELALNQELSQKEVKKKPGFLGRG